MTGETAGVLYGLAVAVHVGAAAVWVGGDLTITVLMARARRSPEPGRLLGAACDAEWVGTRVLAAASIVVLVTAMTLVMTGPHRFTEPWVLTGLAGYLAAALSGALVQGPASARLVRRLQAGPHDRPDVVRRLRALAWISQLQLGVLALVLLDMVVKPG